ncbi:hypothetical protein BP6252_01212 [Coleophoma cylindrospora]|uniref:O-fucosyltransferase family protein n=1 Tax=Coleophoma cylindrospora TaxID=1849047 RepID=A0A3D8SS85_9HELO|nr:hypothetical protein BP6252_01212 [Coleophoma cylindrospora]
MSVLMNRRWAYLAAIALVFVWGLCYKSALFPQTRSSRSAYSRGDDPPRQRPVYEPLAPKSEVVLQESFDSPSAAPASQYFEQAFSLGEPPEYGFPALRQHCAHMRWPEDDVYLHCEGMSAGLTSIVSQVKVCLKMALDAGTGIILPSMPLRDSDDLKNFNFLNGTAYMTYDKWFDARHLIDEVGRVCPQMKILHPEQVASESDQVSEAVTELVPVKNRWIMEIKNAVGYREFTPYFWAGRPFKAFFDREFAALEGLAMMSPDRDESKKGITIIKIASQFLIFRLMDDPTGQELRLWNDLSSLIRFKQEPREIIDKLLSRISRPFYGVHFRVESDTIWSPFEHQLQVDLDALDKAWDKYGLLDTQKPLVYLACGDQGQVERFVKAGKARGWDVIHKWDLAQSDPSTLQAINDLPFDFQGAVDMGIMVKSYFFLGISGSAFSSTIGNARDVTGRYRGSSFTVYDDEGARTHLFNDGDADSYACCL